MWEVDNVKLGDLHELGVFSICQLLGVSVGHLRLKKLNRTYHWTLWLDFLNFTKSLYQRWGPRNNAHPIIQLYDWNFSENHTIQLVFCFPRMSFILDVAFWWTSDDIQRKKSQLHWEKSHETLKKKSWFKISKKSHDFSKIAFGNVQVNHAIQFVATKWQPLTNFPLKTLPNLASSLLA